VREGKTDKRQEKSLWQEKEERRIKKEKRREKNIENRK